ncbi:MAG: putative metal-binding motif-containing protein [Myxococcota bacterium]
MIRIYLFVCCVWLAACASGSSEIDPTDSGAPGDGGISSDSGDGNISDPCANVVCEGFSQCVAGSCVPDEPCATGADCNDGNLCRSGFCVAPDRDVDGDGYNAFEDCDENNFEINPGALESCNVVDEDCDGRIDEGGAAQLCGQGTGLGECCTEASQSDGWACTLGECGCPEGRYDLDSTFDDGCECRELPELGTGAACTDAINLGIITESGTSGETVDPTLTSGTIISGRSIWYEVEAVDGPNELSTDRTPPSLGVFIYNNGYHFDVRFAENPGDQYRFRVHAESCLDRSPDSTIDECPNLDSLTRFSHRVDLSEAGSGHAPCICYDPNPEDGEFACDERPNPTPIEHNADPNVNLVADVPLCATNPSFTTTFYIEVIRNPQPTSDFVTCEPFVLEVSNGIYDS